MKITAAQYAQSFYSLLQKAEDKDAVAEKMLHFLSASGKYRLLPEIMRLMKQIELRAQGKTAVTVTSAHPIDTQTLSDILKKTVGSENVELTTKLSSGYIGGARVATSTTQWDLTVSGQLQEMKKELIG